MKQEDWRESIGAQPGAGLASAVGLGVLAAMRMPSNVQGVIGNWLVLLGQILLLFNAQQQLREDGPGNLLGCLSCQTDCSDEEKQKSRSQ